jgi:hypothetical protein
MLSVLEVLSGADVSGETGGSEWAFDCKACAQKSMCADGHAASGFFGVSVSTTSS